MRLIKDLGMRYNGSRNYRWGIFECPTCGKHIERMTHQGNTQQNCPECAKVLHKKSQIKHGGRYTRLYRTWTNMKARCLCKTSQKYPLYGAKGIKICDAWLEFPEFKRWAESNGYSDTLTIDRIDPKGDYEPSNCQWISNRENAGKDKHLQIGVKKTLSTSKELFLKIEEARKTSTLKDALTKYQVSDTAYRNAKLRYKDNQ